MPSAVVTGELIALRKNYAYSVNSRPARDTRSASKGASENGFDEHEVFTTEMHTLPVGQPFGAALRVEADTDLQGQAGGPPAASEFRFAEEAASFGNSLSFPLNVNVFNLPPDYTVNSASAGIVNNRVLPVPEPSTINLLVFGMFALLLHRRRLR